MYDYSRLPEGLQGGMQMYIEHGISGGGFLNAVLENDLFSAVMRADVTNLKELPNIVRWVHNEAPPYSHGSKLKVKEWINKIREEDDIPTFNLSSDYTIN